MLFLMVFVSACQTFKSKGGRRPSQETDSTKTDFVQNFTSKYNILYNANLMLEGERKGIYNAANKNYQVRLTVFDEPTANGDPHKAMDSLIQKAYKIVNTKQESKYINEAYYIIGRAYYLKGAYYTAAEFFDKLIKDADDEPKYKPLAYAWKSRTLLQINKLEAAGKVIDSAFMFLDGNEKSRTFVNAAMANYLVRVGRVGEAIPFLEYALESNKDRYDRGRWRFLLAQLYRDNGQKDKAYQLFNKLAKSNVPFDMSFEADLQAAFLVGDRGGSGIEGRVKPLRAMLKEGKNMDYKDQILYQIGRIYLEEDDEENAFKFFNLSLAEPNGSAYQTTETYLTIADYRFAQEKYRQAQNYYDSTATVLPADYTDVNKVRRKLVYMTELTNLYEENLWLDTLISLGKLSEVDRTEQALKYAGASLIEKQKELDRQTYLAKKGKKVQGNSNSVNFNNAFATQQNTTMNTGISSNQFYFNNQDALLLGASEFKRKWGNRQLKDDWRFSADNTQPLAAQSGQVQDDQAKLAPKDSFDAVGFVEAEKARYLSAVPTTQEGFDTTLKTIHDNMVVIGNIYRDYTRDNQDAILAYEAFLARFPNTEAGAEVYYSLYRMYDGIDQTKSLVYKNRLLELFPNSLHAMVAKDPYYMDKINRDKRILDRTFEKLFALYTAGDHVAVIRQANEELEGVFQTSGMVAQIEYLKALAIGRVGRVSDFTNALEKIIEKYPTDSLVVPLAQENIAFIEKNPGLFVNRVNALQDIDKSRIAFVDEPDMTPWPALRIDGDYRTGVAIAQVKPKEEPVVVPEEVKQPELTEEKRQEIEMLLAGEMATKPKEVKSGTNIDVTGVSGPQKKADVIVADLGTIEEEKVAAQLETGNIASSNVNGAGINANKKLDAGAMNIGNIQINYGPNEYRDKKLFPDTATYFFTVNVMDPKVNLAPSRYGIGQFNRSRYARTNINHQLRLVNAENQLLFVGPFETYEEVKTYESRILPLLLEIMKVPEEDYNTFIITRETIGTLTDGIQIKNYHQVYTEQ
ncbi:Tetratricopeptide repeat-containing protein [Sphingobacterium wenxiniae]|uniref:Tetratricopeptide repeat-containing protein n=2 Tax=Sphingobacterium wenxiniae TaxID=683125 RepID=A0A1I6TA03_9SPHI|nr:Tetratricopeptide repeat-containing protein [Sphingobacterium wenxiniae]